MKKNFLKLMTVIVLGLTITSCSTQHKNHHAKTHDKNDQKPPQGDRPDGPPPEGPNQ